MTDAWPVGLPQYVLVAGYSEEAGGGVIETSPDTGPTISRRRSTAMARPMTVSFELDKDQLAILLTFYETTLLRGVLPFHFPAPLGGTYLVKFQKDGGPKWAGAGGRYLVVSMSFWILP